MSDTSSIPTVHLQQPTRVETPCDVETDDEYLLSIRPYRPPPKPSSPLSIPSHLELQDLADPVRHPFSRGTSPDVTSSPSELSRRAPNTPSHVSVASPLPSPNQSTLKQPEFIDAETRPGPEDAEGSTRWSFRSRKANQLQPYRFDRLQYKQQLRGNPDAVVAPLSSRRRRSSPASTMDQDFVEDEDEDTQETGELSGLTFTGEEESQSQPRDTFRARRKVPPSRPSPPAPPLPQWFLDGMREISETDSDGDEVVEYLADRARKEQAAEVHNGDLPGVSQIIT